MSTSELLASKTIFLGGGALGPNFYFVGAQAPQKISFLVIFIFFVQGFFRKILIPESEIEFERIRVRIRFRFWVLDRI